MKLLGLLAIFLFSCSFGQNDVWLLEVNEHYQYGYRDTTGSIKIPFGKYEICFTDSFKTYAIVHSLNEGFIGINKLGETMFQVYPYDNGPDEIQDGLFRIIEDGKIGFVDSLGNLIIKPRFHAVNQFSNGAAAFCENCLPVSDGDHQTWVGKWGFINKKGDTIVEPRFDSVLEPFIHGKAKILLGGKIHLIDKLGNLLVE